MISVEDLFDQWYEETEEERLSDGKLHPSSLYTCPRQAVYERRGVARTDFRPAKDKRALIVGSTLHALIQTALSYHIGVAIADCWTEVEVNMSDLGVYGHADAVLLLTDGTYVVIEAKTTSTKSVKFLMGKNGSGLPQSAHSSQGLTYLYGITHYPWYSGEGDDKVIHLPLGTVHGTVPAVRVVYWEKDNHAFHEYDVELTDEWVTAFLTYVGNLNKLREDELPARVIEDPERFPCSWCSWRTQCYVTDADKTGVVFA